MTPTTQLTADDLDRIHRLLSEDIRALERELRGLDAPEDRRAKKTELEAARQTRARVEATESRLEKAIPMPAAAPVEAGLVAALRITTGACCAAAGHLLTRPNWQASEYAALQSAAEHGQRAIALAEGEARR